MPYSPEKNCDRCPRLVDFRQSNRIKFSDWHNAPVESFGPIDAALLIVGLAPGLRGANKTSRPFTGDAAGVLLYGTLRKFLFASGTYDERADDGLTLHNCRITNAVRCVPPQNKPITSEVVACSKFLQDELAKLQDLQVVLALGTLAHYAILRALGYAQSSVKFSHGAIHKLPTGYILADSYHCSRYNTNTGRLTKPMFEDVFASIRHLIES
jgi:uracil-DNA glycosylase family 4